MEEQQITETGDIDAFGATILPSGIILLFVQKGDSVYKILTNDTGISYESEEEMTEFAGYQYPVVARINGRLLCFLWKEIEDDPDGKGNGYLSISQDNGATWTEPAIIMVGEDEMSIDPQYVDVLPGYVHNLDGCVLIFYGEGQYIFNGANGEGAWSVGD